MYVCILKVALAVLPMERGNRLGQGERSLNGPIFLTPRVKLARGTPPTAYYLQLAGSAANFALGLSCLPRGRGDQSGIPRACVTGYATAPIVVRDWDRHHRDLIIRYEPPAWSKSHPGDVIVIFILFWAISSRSFRFDFKIHAKLIQLWTETVFVFYSLYVMCLLYTIGGYNGGPLSSRSELILAFLLQLFINS